MSIAYLTRKVQFTAAHRYYRPEWSEAENHRVFGACANEYGHGHNYVLEVTVAARIDPVTGFSVDLGDLDALLQREVMEVYDHRHLNYAVDAFGPGGQIPTTENILAHCWPRLVAGLPSPATLHRLRLHEDPSFYVDYFGGGAPV